MARFKAIFVQSRDLPVFLESAILVSRAEVNLNCHWFKPGTFIALQHVSPRNVITTNVIPTI